jgi:hypothetical protein
MKKTKKSPSAEAVASCQFARHWLQLESRGTARVLRKHGPFDNSYEAQKAKVFGFFLTWPDRKLNDPFVKPVIVEAAERNDLAFFRKLGRFLELPAEVGDDNLARALLLKYWCDPPKPLPGFPPLCCLTLRGRVAVLNTLLGRKTQGGGLVLLREDITESAVSKWQQRLQLTANKSGLADATFNPSKGAKLV